MNVCPNPEQAIEPEGTRYEIRVCGVLDEKWAFYFSPFLLAAGEKETILTGYARDQAELFGILLKLRDLGILLLSVRTLT